MFHRQAQMGWPREREREINGWDFLRMTYTFCIFLFNVFKSNTTTGSSDFENISLDCQFHLMLVFGCCW